MEGVPALFFATRRTSVGPFAQLVSLPGAAEIILAINDRGRIADGDSFEVGIDHPRAADAPHQIIASERCVTGREPFELVIGKNSLYFRPYCLIESIALLSQRVVHQQEAAVGKKASQNLDLFLGEGFKLVFAGHVKK